MRMIREMMDFVEMVDEEIQEGLYTNVFTLADKINWKEDETIIFAASIDKKENPSIQKEARIDTDKVTILTYDLRNDVISETEEFDYESNLRNVVRLLKKLEIKK